MACWALLLMLAGCAAIPSPGERRTLAETLAADHGWQAQTIPAGDFPIAAWWPARAAPADDLAIYIEGDGLAWITPQTPSSEPTPVNPIALKLALAQPEGQAAYLARPCQYVDAVEACRPAEWTDRRFGPEVLDAMDRAVDATKARFRAQRLTLVGYSGGAAIAALLAERRNDVVRLVTVAGNLDHRAWTAWHGVSPLTGSLNPADGREALAPLPQWHFAGADDRVVPPELVRRFAADLPHARLRIEPGFDHRCCWAENWPRLWRESRQGPTP